MNDAAHAAASGAHSAVGSAAEHLILRLLLQFIVVLIATRVVTVLVRRLGQTDVSGEILAGILLGPSLLGAFAPGLMTELFHVSTSTVFVGLAQVGLIFLMFQIGQEFDFRAILTSRDRHRMAYISLIGIVVPFALGYFTAPYFHARLAAPQPPLAGFRLFFAIAMSITAIPILGRIFMELRLSHTRLAAITIGAAAIDDVVGWLLLGVVTLLATQHFSTGWVLWRMVGLALYLTTVLLVVRPLLKRYLGAQLQRHGRLTAAALTTVLIVLFASAITTSLMNVFAIIGGFAIGVAVHDEHRFVREWKMRIGPLVNTFFLPLFFAYTGLRTDIGALASWSEVGQCLLVIAIAFGGKFGGVYLAARSLGGWHKSAAALATAMNTRALMELIALNIGFELGVLPRPMFTKLVIMAIASTFIATPLIRRFMRGQELSVDRGPQRLTVRTALSLVSANDIDIERAWASVRELAAGVLHDAAELAQLEPVFRQLLETVPRYRAPRSAAAPVLDLSIEAEHVSVAVSCEVAARARVLALEQCLDETRAAAGAQAALFASVAAASARATPAAEVAELLTTLRTSGGRLSAAMSSNQLTLTVDLEVASASAGTQAAA